MSACDSCTPHKPGDDPVFRRVLWIALVINAVMFVVEMTASQVGDSMSLQADALDFFGDAANYAISLFVLGMPLAVRARAALIKGATMAMFGIWVIGSAAYRAAYGSAPEPFIMGYIAVIALLANITVAAMLFHYRTGDSNRRSIWLCSRNDVIGNLAVLAAAAGVLTTSSRWPDLAVAAIIATLSLTSALEVFRQANTERQSVS